MVHVLSISVLEGKKGKKERERERKGRKEKREGKGMQEEGGKRRRCKWKRYGWASGSQCNGVPRPTTSTSPGTSKKWRSSDLTQMYWISYLRQSRDSKWLEFENHWAKQRWRKRWYEQVVGIDSGFTRVKKSYQTWMGGKVGNAKPRRKALYCGGKID